MVRKTSSARRKDFVDATIVVIAEQGIARATTRAIAEACASPLASLHYVFKSKSELFHAVYEDMLSDMVIKVEHGDGGQSITEAVQVLFRRIVDWHLKTPNVARAQWELYAWMLREEREAAITAFHTAKITFRNVFGKVIRNDEQLLEQITRAAMCFSDGLLVFWWTYEDEALLRAEIDTACKTLQDLVNHATVGVPA